VYRAYRLMIEMQLNQTGGTEMPYLGDLPQAGGYKITVTDCPSTVGVTVFQIRRDRISEVEILKLVPDPTTGVAESGPRTIGANAGRLVFIASITGGTAQMTINGNTFPLAPDATATFEVV
jgi:hypothetical protein